MNQLSKLEKQAIISLMNQVMCVDNDIDITELELISYTSSKFHLESKDFEEALTLPTKQVEEIVAGMQQHEKVLLLKSILKTILIDKKINAQETKFVQELGNKIGIDLADE